MSGPRSLPVADAPADARAGGALTGKPACLSHLDGDRTDPIDPIVPIDRADHLDRRAFLGHVSMLAIGSVLAAACGDGQIGNTPTGVGGSGTLSVTPGDYSALAMVGGIARLSGTTRPIALVRSTSTTYRAFSLICPHQGSTVNVTGGSFQCPNHLARFDATGKWIGGQVTGNLTELTVTALAAGVLEIRY